MAISKFGNIVASSVAPSAVYQAPVASTAVSASEGTLSNVELTQKGGTEPTDYYSQSVYIQKNKNIVSLHFPKITSINVNTNTDPIVSNFILPSSNIVPDTNHGSGTAVFCGTNQAHAKIVYDATASNIKLIITPTTAFGATTTSIEPFHLEYKCSNDTETTSGDWGTIAPTVVISNPRTDNLIIAETTTITFTISESVADFNLDDTITSSKGTLSAFTAVSATTYTATYTPDNFETGTYEIRVLPNSFSFNSVSNKFDTRLLKGIDTDNPSITSMVPTSPNIASGGGTTTITLLFSEPMANSVLTNLNAGNETVISPADASIGTWSTADNTTYTCTFTSGATNGACQIQFTNLSVSDASGNTTLKTQALTQGLNIGILALLEFDATSITTSGVITSWNGENGINLTGQNIKSGSGGSVSTVISATLNNKKVIQIDDSFLYTPVLNSTIFPDEYWIICLVETTAGDSNLFSIVDEDWWTTTSQAFRYSFQLNNGQQLYYQYGGQSFGLQAAHLDANTNNTPFPSNSWVFCVYQVRRGSISTAAQRLKWSASNGTTKGYADSAITPANTSALTGQSKRLLLGAYLSETTNGGSGSDITDNTSPPNYVYTPNQKIAYFGTFPLASTETELDAKIAQIKTGFGITW
jgi:hypothetical protein